MNVYSIMKTCFPCPPLAARPTASSNLSSKTPTSVAVIFHWFLVHSTSSNCPFFITSTTQSIISCRSAEEWESFQAESQNPEAWTFLKIWRDAGRIKG